MDFHNIGRIPPQNIESEQSVLGAMLLDNEILSYIFSNLNASDFYLVDHQEIFEACFELFGRRRPVDVITLTDQLKARETIDNVGGMQYLASLMDSVPTTANTKHYVEIVKRNSVSRNIIKSCNSIIDMAYDKQFENSIDLKNAAMQILDVPISDDRQRKTKILEILSECLTDIENQYKVKIDDKLYTGFSDLDRVTAGFHPEELTIIAARPGAGKTAFAIQLMLNLARKNHCLLISREMSTLQIGKRILSNYSGVNGQKLRFCKSLNDEDWTKLGKAAGHIAGLPIEINDQLTTIEEIRSYCRELRNKGRLDIVFLDYLGLLRTLKKCSSRREEIEDISRRCKELTLEFNIPIIVLCQLNRDNVREGREPRLFDLRESGSIEQDADNVIFLHVPQDTDETLNDFDIKVIISKQRNGPTGYVYLRYYKSTFRFCGYKSQ